MTGYFAVSKAGHDKDTCYVIVGEEGDMVYLCDGRLKTMSSPKKKKKKHIQLIKRSVSADLLRRLCHTGEDGVRNVQDEEIKYELKQYLREKKEKKVE